VVGGGGGGEDAAAAAAVVVWRRRGTGADNGHGAPRGRERQRLWTCRELRGRGHRTGASPARPWRPMAQRQQARAGRRRTGGSFSSTSGSSDRVEGGGGGGGATPVAGRSCDDYASNKGSNSAAAGAGGARSGSITPTFRAQPSPTRPLRAIQDDLYAPLERTAGGAAAVSSTGPGTRAQGDISFT